MSELNLNKRFKRSLVTSNIYPLKSGFSGVSIPPIDINELIPDDVNVTISSDNGFAWFEGWGAAQGMVLPDSNTITLTFRAHKSFEPLEIGAINESYNLLAEKSIEVIRNSADGTLSLNSIYSEYDDDIYWTYNIYNDGLAVELTFEHTPSARQISCVVTSTSGGIIEKITGLQSEVDSIDGISELQVQELIEQERPDADYKNTNAVITNAQLASDAVEAINIKNGEILANKLNLGIHILM